MQFHNSKIILDKFILYFLGKKTQLSEIKFS